MESTAQSAPVAPQTNYQNTPTPTKKNSLNSVVLAIIILVLFLALLGGGYLIYRNIIKKNSNNSAEVKQNTSPEQAYAPPISLNNPAVIRAGYTYALQGNIKDTRSIPEGFELITDIPGQDIPKLIYDKNTPVYFKENGKFKRTNINQLKSGQKVNISLFYGFTLKKWFIDNININVSSPSASTAN